MSKAIISSNLVQQVINLYNTNQSIIDTAKELGLSTVKVRKILITEGLWQSDTSVAIGRLLGKGLSTEEIANQLYMSVKNVQAYMPYERGVYKGEEVSSEAVRSDKYRKRMKQAAAMQISNNLDMIDTTKSKGGHSDMPTNFETDTRKTHISKVLRLHCELNMDWVDDQERTILKRYGSMKQSISRDVLVPADITLHALHYAILRMFGWQNSHMHCYSLPEDVFDGLTEQRFATWARLAGVYFRFPSENYADIYWDDDYKEGQSFKSWMRKKYTGPYRYKGYSEHYLDSQMEVSYMFRHHPEITVRKFSWDKDKAKEPYEVKLMDATVKEVQSSFTDVMCHELLERLPLAQVLKTPGVEHGSYGQIREDLITKLREIDVMQGLDVLLGKGFKSAKREQAFLAQHNVDVFPVTDRLKYSYDYGDGWEVWITCDGVYEMSEEGKWTGIDDKPLYVKEEDLREVVMKHRPVCIAKDGIELLDDVGGIGGFCDMLLEIYAADSNSEEEMAMREDRLAWANMLGWTGRRISPKNTL